MMSGRRGEGDGNGGGVVGGGGYGRAWAAWWVAGGVVHGLAVAHKKLVREHE